MTCAFFPFFQRMKEGHRDREVDNQRFRPHDVEVEIHSFRDQDHGNNI